jgi:hypothetical protein
MPTGTAPSDFNDSTLMMPDPRLLALQVLDRIDRKFEAERGVPHIAIGT